jgi:hypothetical protein
LIGGLLLRRLKKPFIPGIAVLMDPNCHFV